MKAGSGRRREIGTVGVAACLTFAAALGAPAHAADGTWERAWGKDVIQSGKPGDMGMGAEICTAAADCQGGSNATALGGELSKPRGVATDAAGNVYVADTDNHRIQKFDSNGNFVLTWGKGVFGAGTGEFEICAPAAACGPGTAGGKGGELNNPRGVATDSAGNVYVADTLNHRIQKFDSDGNFLLAWGKDVEDDAGGGTGFEVCIAADGETCKAGVAGTLGGELSNPDGVAADTANNVYVADTSNHRIQKFSTAGVWERTWGEDVISGAPGGFEICTTTTAACKIGETGGLGGELNVPRGVAADTLGNVYVADTSNHRLQKFSSLGVWERAWGKDVIQGGALGDQGNLYEICTNAADCQGGSNSTAQGGELNSPFGVAVDPDENVYAADWGNNRIQRFDSSGTWERAWGKDVIPGNAEPGFEICTPMTAVCKAGADGGLGGELITPFGVGTDPAGALYVAEGAFFNHRIQKFADPPPPPPPPDGGDAGDTDPPDTTITQQPNDKTKKKSTTFGFTANEPATFACVLDGREQFKPCTSPITFKVRKGKHSFQVVATDVSGNKDPTPASDSWKVKKRKKKN